MNNKSCETLDTSGLTCPMPILRLKQALKLMAAGEQLKVIATDPGTQSDFPAFAAQTGHKLLETDDDGEHYFYLIEKV